jgi:WD40 repeat protein
VASPNVCRVFDLVEVEGRELVSMEYVDGTTLAEVLRERGPLALDEAQEIASQFLAGLAAVHDAGLVHRDLKPENLMLTRAGRVVVMDLGLARGVVGARRGTVSGTPPYMPPEQVRGEALDPRADVFAAGVVLAEMVDPEGTAGEAARQRLWQGIRGDPPEVAETPWAPVIRRAVAADREARYASAFALARALEEVTLRAVGAEDARPYPGLASFNAEDAEYFFGREVEVEALWRKLRRPRLLGLIGPSGSGKSSFLRAGLLAARPEGWSAVVTTPGNRPFSALAQALLPELEADRDALEDLLRFDEPDVAVPLVARWRGHHAQALVVVDQFEELFTQNPETVQEAYARLLHRLALDAEVHVLLSMRDDFLFHCQGFETLQPIFAELTPLAAPTGAALRRAVVQPALKCGYRFEDEALVEAMIAEVEGERGTLPLLAFACAQLWERRDRERGVLSQEAYEEIGGVAGALAQHADATLERIGPDRVPQVREIFRNLVTAQGTRAARDRDELLSVFPAEDRASVDAILDALVAARLLVSYEAEAEAGARGAPATHDGGERPAEHRRLEIVHESLLTKWPRLVRWRAQDEDGLVLRDQLHQAAQVWARRGRDEDFLWTGTAFREYQLWRERYPGGLTTLEEAFARAMTALAKRRWRRRRLAAAALVAIALAVATATTILWQRAVAAQRETEIRRLAGASKLALDEDPERAILLALEAAEVSRRAGEPVAPEVIAALHQAVQTSRLEMRFDAGVTVAFRPDGSVMTMERLAPDAVPGAVVAEAAFSPDGTLYAERLWHQEEEPAQIIVWDPATREEVIRLRRTIGVSPGDRVHMGVRMAWSPHGELIAAQTLNETTQSRRLTVWEVTSGQEVSSFRTHTSQTPTFLDSQRLAVADARGERVVFYDIATGRETDRLETPGYAPEELAFDPLRNLLVMGSTASWRLQAWDLESGSLEWTSGTSHSLWPALHPDTGVVAATGSDAAVRLLDLDTGSELGVLRGHTQRTYHASFSSDGTWLVSVGERGETLMWDIRPAGPRAAGAIDLGPAHPFLISVGPGTEVAVAAYDGARGSVQSYLLGTGEPVSPPLASRMIHFLTPAPVSLTRRLVAALDDDGQGWVRHLDTLEVILKLPPCTVPLLFSSDGAALVLGAPPCEADEAPPDAGRRSRVIEIPSGEELLDLGEDPIFLPERGRFNPAGLFEPDSYLALPRGNRLDVYEASNGHVVTTLDAEGGVMSAGFDPSGRFLAVGGGELRAWVLDMAQIAEGVPARDAIIFDREVDPGTLPAVAINQDGVLATSKHGSLRLWDVVSGEHLVRVPVHTARPSFAEFSPEGDDLLYVDEIASGYVLRRFPVDPERLIELAQSRVTRDFTTAECDRYHLDC